jgi:DNA-binding transcriptional LysR family regulator
MNLNHLAVFDAVAREGGFSRGAACLRISQPAVSKQVVELETWTGTSLVDRSGRAFRLTEAGLTLAGYAHRIFALAAEAERALEELQGLRRGRLAIGASTTIGIYLMRRCWGFSADAGRASN